MASRLTITLVGADEAARKFPRFAQAISGAQLMAAVTAGAKVVQNTAKVKVPKRTQMLARSITIEPIEQSETSASVKVGPSEPYGKYVEYGTGVYATGPGGSSAKKVPWRFKTGDGSWVTTRGQRPQPFMRPAWDENQSEIRQEIRDALADMVEGAAK